MSEQINRTLENWRRQHSGESGYFTKLPQHRSWRIYDEMPPWFLQLAEPCATDTALEIGCGYGEWMVPLARLIDHVDGFDIHESLREKFEEIMERDGIMNTEMMVGAGAGIPFADRGYSLIYSISVFQHLPRELVHIYLQGIATHLNPGGRAVLHFLNGTYPGAHSELPDMLAWQHTGIVSVGWTRDEVTAACEAAGLRVREARISDAVCVRVEAAR